MVRYQAPEGFTFDPNSEQYYNSVVVDDPSTGKKVQWVTWFDANTGQYEQIPYPMEETSELPHEQPHETPVPKSIVLPTKPEKEHSTVQPEVIDENITVLDETEMTLPKFRYVGSRNHPKEIVIDINVGDLFSIGRFDASVGSKQSDFEFDKKTKAVSRQHATIERDTDSYYILDFGSRAGTFMNGQKIPLNEPIRLTSGCRVSFGHRGADYVWEE